MAPTRTTPRRGLLRRRKGAGEPPQAAPLRDRPPRRASRIVAAIGRGAVQVGRRPDLLVALLALVALSIAWPTISLTHDVSVSLWPVLGVMQVVPLLFVWRLPAVGWSLAVVGSLVWWLLVPQLATAPMPWPVMQFLVLLVTLLGVALWARAEEVLVATVVTAVLMLAAMPAELKGWALGQALVVGFGLLIRWLVISRRQLAQQEERTETERAQRAVVEERARIARELHDVVAHHMSMIVVQAQSAPLRLEVQQPEIAKEFADIEGAARQALGEVRGVLGVLRQERQAPEHEPQPGLAQMPQMLEATRAAGMALTWSLDVAPDDCPAGAALVLYRVLQESLANAGRHAPGSAVGVTLRRGGERIVLTVHNGPGGPSSVERAGGAGIDGMFARAEAVGGTLRAEPDGVGGFVVQADLPVSGRPETAGLG